MAAKRTGRQAVVLIHGIGEQHPMGTIRPFVKAVLGSSGDDPAYYNKPDPMSSLFELRRLRSTSKPPTDFYEYYWAYNVEGTKLWDVLSWLLRLVGRPRHDVPEGLHGFWLISRVLLAAIILLVLGGAFSAYAGWFTLQPQYGVVWLVSTALLSALQLVMVGYLGDAARYLSPRPQNIKLRQVIRSEGVKLLETLHKSQEYDRIILVGHSLGSVIGYDLLTHFWQQCNDKLPQIANNPDVQQFIRERMAAGKSAQPFVRDALSKAGEAAAAGGDTSAFRNCQKRAWCEQRYFGNPWLVTDFVTLGSPLAHAMLLLAESGDEFRSRKTERELVTCPPARDQKGYGYSLKPAFVLGANPATGAKGAPMYNALALHHAAPFAVTRWTNLYFPARFGMFGDIVGGRLAPVLGAGIRDVAVSTSRLNGFARFTVLAHTSYWLTGDDGAPAGDAKPGALRPALQALKEALALGELRSFRVEPPDDGP